MQPKRRQWHLLGPFFVCQRFGALCRLALVVLGVLALPCAFSPFAPPIVHSCHCCIMSTIGIHNPTHEQRLTAVVLGAGILFFCQMGRGRGLTWHHCCIMLTIGIHNTPHEQQLAAVVLGSGILFFSQMGRGRGLTWWGIPLLRSPSIPFCYPHIPAVCCCGWDENFWSTNKVPITCQACTCCITC